MEAIVHLTSSDPDLWRLAVGRVGRLLEAGDDPERITLLSDIDGARLVTEDAPTTGDVDDLLDDEVRVATNRSCLEARDIPVGEVVDDVEVLENSTLELVRLQDAGASLVTVPSDGSRRRVVDVPGVREVEERLTGVVEFPEVASPGLDHQTPGSLSAPI